MDADQSDPARRLAEHFAQLSSPIQLEMPPQIAYMLVGNLQLALRHPANIGPTSLLVRKLIEDLIVRLADGDEDIADIMRLGDDPKYDVPRET